MSEVAPALAISGLTRFFGGLPALNGVDLELQPGEVLGLLGPNGSGKTTLINVISGAYKPTAGTVQLMGRDATGASPDRLVHLGLNRTFQTPRPFLSMTVEENVLVSERYGGRGRAAHDDVLETVGIGPLRHRRAESLNSGEQKRLDLARALATSPDVLLVDEFAAGLRGDELEDAAVLMRKLASGGRALVVVEHLMGFVRQVADRVMVLNAGKPIFSGSLDEAAKDKAVVEVFLGQ